jgi:hypothetical protein
MSLNQYTSNLYSQTKVSDVMQIGIYVGMSISILESILFFTYFIFVLSVEFMFNNIGINFAARIHKFIPL